MYEDLGIIEAAIKLEPDVIVAGKRHHEILAKLAETGHTAEYKKWHQDGFIVINDNFNLRFRTREECTEWAKAHNIPMIGSVLTSEDVISADKVIPVYMFFGKLEGID